ncbi:MAG: type III-B CRISPR-associated protein Cas10/Cmr2 [Candidatus Bathyarchaeota archaeon]|jgi:CRISPR-associated protein Cmr2|nr:type III-B CRISPR-associated protein Cas10/Cmr2 [Candidatus Bathyarchaeota archaeon]
MMGEFWQSKIKAFLHDPPDKALILFHKPHESKRDEILRKLGLEYDDRRLDLADHIASAMQRLDIPEEFRMNDAKSCDGHICFKGLFKPVFKHTLSGKEESFQEIRDFIAAHGYEKALEKYEFHIEEIAPLVDKSDWKRTYFAIWRFLPEKYQLGYSLPADTRIPDHNIWDHLDVTAAISSCLGDLGLFAIKMPAVQEFISHSRKLSDLWASSHLYSALIFEGIKAIADELGPDVIIYPNLRGNPLFDLFLIEKFQDMPHEHIDVNKVRVKVVAANLPNTFLCFIPVSKAESFAKRCEESIREKWKEFSNRTKDLLKGNNIIGLDEELWNKQVEDSLFVSKGWIKFLNFDSYNGIKESIPTDLRDKEDKWLMCVEDVERRSNYGHFYLPTYELLGTILTQNSRLWEAWEEKPITGRKCLMCGLRSAIIERKRDEENRLIFRSWTTEGWKEQKGIDEAFLKVGERLCAVCAIKRLYREIFRKVYGTNAPTFESVVEIAGKKFIDKIETEREFSLVKRVDIELIYEHEWESEDKRKTTIKELEAKLKKNGRNIEDLKSKLEELWETVKPNKYYSILMMDGDRIGKMLSGENLPNFTEFLHPVFENKIKESLGRGQLIGMKRILHPSLHIAISSAMKDFSIHKVPEIINKNDGFLIYSGGDDVLALFAADKVLNVAKELQDYFRKDFYDFHENSSKKRLTGLGKHASMSAGIVFAHYKYPLYDVIEKVREAEKSAKTNYGRNAFCMTFIKHSGEVLTTSGKWDVVDNLNSIANALVSEKVSHRFIYDLMDASRTLNGDMLKAEIKRLLKRRKTEKATDEEISGIYGEIACLIDKYQAKELPIEDVGKALKILYDAYRGGLE